MAKKQLTPEEIAAKAAEKKLRIEQRKAGHVDARPFAEISSLKTQRKSHKKKRLNRSVGGDIALFIFLLLCGVISFLPLLLIILNAFKPLDELFRYPPTFFVANPTFTNFTDLAVVLSTSTVPFARYLFNTIIVTVLGTGGHLIIASMCAYPLAKYKLPGSKFIMGLIVYSLMFPGSVTAIPHYMIFTWLGLIDTWWCLILPVIGASLGLYLMKSFMNDVPMSYIESAKLDGAGDFRIFWSIVMPLVKPASLTLIILEFQSLWSADGSTYIYTESKKMLHYAINQIATGGTARQGVLAAVNLIMILVPIIMFIISQSSMVDTMAHSGLK